MTRRHPSSPSVAVIYRNPIDEFPGQCVDLAHLDVPEVGVYPTSIEQRVVSPAFDKATIVQNEHVVRVPNRRESMGDDERRPVGRQSFEVLLNQHLGFVVHVARRFIEDEDRWVADHRAGDGYPLALAAREFDTALADLRVIAIRQLNDELMSTSLLRRTDS